MFKLLTLLAAGMFLALLIGGKDEGQMRQGLAEITDPAARPALRDTPAAQNADANLDVTRASFSNTPVSAPVVGGFVVMEADKTTAVAMAPEVEAAPELPILYVNSRSVNVRGGPSTDYAVVDQLTRAEAVLVVSPEQDGWIQVRIEGDGIDGYVAARLLTDVNPAN